MSSNAQTNCYHTADSGQHHTKLWISRDLKYKLGTVVFMFSSGLYFVSLVSHPWFEIHEWNLYAVHPIVEWSLITELPTKFCTYDNSECIESTISRILLFICLSGYALTYIILGTENCRRVDTRIYHSRKLEATMLLTVIMGVLGLVFMKLFKQEISLPVTPCWPEYLVRVSLALLFIAMALCALGNGRKLAGIVVSDSTSRSNHTAPAAAQYHPAQVTVFQHSRVAQPGLPLGASYAQPPPKYTATVTETQYPTPASLPPQYPSTQPLLFPQNQPLGPPPPYIPPPAYPTNNALQLGAESDHPFLQMEGCAKSNTQPTN